jgi:hypothetical protein
MTSLRWMIVGALGATTACGGHASYIGPDSGASDAPIGRDAPLGVTDGGGGTDSLPTTTDAALADASRTTADAQAVAADAAPCPDPTPGTWYVGPRGDDTTGNGSQGCPFVTITHALAQTLTATGPTTIVVQSGGGPARFIYGNGCSAGAGKCDATPIRVTDGMNKGILITGSSTDTGAIDVIGGTGSGDVAVFIVNAPDVGFTNLTISPRRVAAAGSSGRVAGAEGIRFNAPPATTTEASVTNVVIDGIPLSNTSESTGPGIEIQGGASPTIGPGVTISGGDHSVLVTQATAGAPAKASDPIITSSTAAPSTFSGAQFACVRVETTNALATAVPSATIGASSGQLHLQDCGGNGGVSVDTVLPTTVTVAGTLIDASSTAAAAYYGVRARSMATVEIGDGVTITGLNATPGGATPAGLEVDDNASAVVGAPTPGANLTITGCAGDGVQVTGNGVAKMTGVVANGNLNGVVCGPPAIALSAPAITLNGSTTLENKGDGVAVGATCTAALDSDVFNKGQHLNGKVGLCYQPVTALSVTTSTWYCQLRPAGACQPSDSVNGPQVWGVTGCDTQGDYDSDNANLTVADPQTCCGQ